MSNTIEQNITIEAPIAIVWDVLTKPEHVKKWFSDEADFSPEAGSKGQFRWKQLGAAPLEIIAADKPNFFSYRWTTPDLKEDQSTVVEFHLAEAGKHTTLHLIERGVDELSLNDAEKAKLATERIDGWQDFLGKLQRYASTQEA